MLDLWLIRHAESEGNVDGSEADTGLSPGGRAQAVSLERALRGVAFDLVLTSPLRRARATAELALPLVTASVDARLTELEAEGRVEFLDTSALSQEQIATELARAPRRPVESGRAFMERVRSWRSSLPQAGRVVAFTHVAVAREIIALLLGFREAPQDVAHASIFQLELHDQHARATRWNDVSHLLPARG